MRRITPRPSAFTGENEESYWHGAQDMAFRAGCSIEVRGEDVVLVFDDGEERLCCLPTNERAARRHWFYIWSQVKARFPRLYLRR